jgi:hypothetical protein
VAALQGIAYDHDPRPEDPITLARDEVGEACDRLAAAGVPLRPDRDEIWRDFAGWRVNYDRVLVGLASSVMAPFAPWSSDRSVRLARRPPLPSWRLEELPGLEHPGDGGGIAGR